MRSRQSKYVAWSPAVEPSGPPKSPPPALNHNREGRPHTRASEAHSPNAWRNSQVFVAKQASVWDAVQIPTKVGLAKPGLKREMARQPLLHLELIKPWNPTYWPYDK